MIPIVVKHKSMTPGLQQIAFGIGDIDSNPDMLKIFWYCRDHGVIPNVTVNGWGITEEWAEALAGVCGAVAVSRYNDKDVCFDAVKKLTDAGLKQVNIHQLVSKETYYNCIDTINSKIENDPRLEELNAIVFLSLKQKGRGWAYHTLPQEDYDFLISKCLDNWLKFGFDSCSCHKFLDFIDRHQKYHVLRDILKEQSEPCESTCFSIYINVDSEIFPCSFCEGSVPPCGITHDFIQDVWFSDPIKKFRNKLLKGGRICPIYEI